MRQLKPQPKTHATAPGALTLDEFASQVYLPHIRLRKRSWQMDERIVRRHLSPFFGARRLSGIARVEVEDWLNGLLERGLTPPSCNRFLAVFKTLCAFAERRGHLAPGASPCLGVASLKIHAARERFLTRGEAQRLMEQLGKSDRQEALALRLLLLTGARKNEILKARWEDVNFEQHLLTVPRSKSGRPRHIVLSEPALAVIRRLAPQSAGPWLFPGRPPSKPLSDLFRFWRTLREDVGLGDMRIHDLRHSFASFLVNSGHSLYAVQKILGHADPRTTMRYAHLGRDALLAAAERVGGMVESSVKENNSRQAPLRRGSASHAALDGEERPLDGWVRGD